MATGMALGPARARDQREAKRRASMQHIVQHPDLTASHEQHDAATLMYAPTQVGAQHT